MAKRGQSRKSVTTKTASTAELTARKTVQGDHLLTESGDRLQWENGDLITLENFDGGGKRK